MKKETAQDDRVAVREVSNGHRGRNPKINLEQALKLRFSHGLSYALIAEQFGCTKGAVQRRLTRFSAFLEHPEDLAGYRVNKAEFLESVELKLLASLADAAKLKKASLNNAAYSFQQVFNAHRLCTGQSTENVNLLSKIIGQANEDPFGKKP